MRDFPDITIADPNYSLWLWVILPGILAVLFLLSEFWIEKWTDKKWGKPVVGVGYILMGISLFVGVMGYSLVPDAIEAERTISAVRSLEEIGFQEIRISVDNGTFGAYYDGELMRGALIEIQNHPGTYKVVETPPPS